MSVESLNRALYGSKDTVLYILKRITFLATLLAVALILYGYGFELSHHQYEVVLRDLDYIFLYFIFWFLIRLLYSFERKQFLKESWFEGILMFLLLINLSSFHLFDNNIVHLMFKKAGIKDYRQLSQLFVSLYMLLMAFLEFAKASTSINKIKFKPATTFIYSFILLIASGTGILMLPAITVAPGGMNVMDAMFTTISACCVTGLTVVDTATYFTFKGQLAIMLLIQAGGLGIVTFATFFASFIRKGITLKHQTIFHDLMSPDSLSDSKSLFRQIVFITFIIEATGAIFIFFTWGPNVKFDGFGDKVFHSVFHSISAFCNAGFSTFTNSMYEEPIRKAYILHLGMAGIIFMGGIGFSTIKDIFSIKLMRERLENPWKDWKTGTKITLYTSFVLIFFGALFFYVLEKENTLKGMKLIEAMIVSVFHSVSARTAGFNSVDFTHLTTPVLIVLIFLMFVGASPGSCGGGIKTTTFILVFISTITTIREKKSFEIGKRSISPEQMYKALSVFTFAATYNLIAIFLLSITDPNIEIIRLAFEEVSAFGTVGLSTGITASLSFGGKIVIMFSMFIGRVGLLTLALSLSTKAKSVSHKYPNANLLVG